MSDPESPRPARPVFQRASRARTAYRWVRRVAYAFALGGIGTALVGKQQSGPDAMSRLELSGYGLFLVAFVLFLVSYGFYIAIRIIETRPAD